MNYFYHQCKEYCKDYLRHFNLLLMKLNLIIRHRDISHFHPVRQAVISQQVKGNLSPKISTSYRINFNTVSSHVTYNTRNDTLGTNRVPRLFPVRDLVSLVFMQAIHRFTAKCLHPVCIDRSLTNTC